MERAPKKEYDPAVLDPAIEALISSGYVVLASYTELNLRFLTMVQEHGGLAVLYATVEQYQQHSEEIANFRPGLISKDRAQLPPQNMVVLTRQGEEDKMRLVLAYGKTEPQDVAWVHANLGETQPVVYFDPDPAQAGQFIDTCIEEKNWQYMAAVSSPDELIQTLSRFEMERKPA